MTLLTIIGMGIVTFIVRFCFFGSIKRSSLPLLVNQALKYVTPAVLMAIIVPSILVNKTTGQINLFPNPYFLGSLFAFLIGLFQKERFFLIFLSGIFAFALANFFYH